MNDIERRYIEFAYRVSFFEFIQEEFRMSDLNAKTLKDELKVLKDKKNWNINELADFIKQYPKSFLIFQQIVQLIRFTNAQLIHFIFDVEKLNSLNMESIFEYLIFNIKYDEEFRKLYLGLIDRKMTHETFVKNLNQYDKKYLITIFKQTVSKYVDKILKKSSIFEKRVQKSEFADVSIRFSNYLLNNLKLNETLESIDIENFLKYKKVPVDTKSIHGNFAKLKITRILESNDFINIDNRLDKIKVLKHDLSEQIEVDNLQGKTAFCTERYVEGIIKIKEGKLKKFDIIIFKNLQPAYLFEVNFYSTEGTKIGINQDEYVDLINYIKQNLDGLEFYWITDGNYWLTSQGKKRFKNLLESFKTIYNINSFAEDINNFK